MLKLDAFSRNVRFKKALSKVASHPTGEIRVITLQTQGKEEDLTNSRGTLISFLCGSKTKLHLYERLRSQTVYVAKPAERKGNI